MNLLSRFAFGLMLLGLWLGVPHAGGQDSGAAAITIDGHPAHPTRLIARVKEEPAQALAKGKGVATLSIPGDESVVRSFASIPGLVVLEPGAISARAAAPAAAGKVSEKELILQLKERRRELLESGRFEYVEPDWIITIDAIPGDSAFTGGTLWGLRNTGQSGGSSGVDIDAVEAWDVTTGSSQVVVGVIDTGIRYTHQDLAANMWRNPGEIAGNGRDDDGNGVVDDVFGFNAINRSGNPMDDNNHGTHCAGTIGAVGNGGGPHVGVAWNVRLMALKFLAADGSGSTSDAIACIDYAINEGADVLSNSWGGGGFSSGLRDAIRRANNAGILFVAAAGNDASDNDRTPQYPAGYDESNVISVASVTRTGALSSFSNYGRTSVDLGAPGSSIYSTTAASDSSYASFNGTSMATPHVSGVAALILSRDPGLSVAAMRQRLLGTTRPLSSLGGRTVSGGMVSALNALGGAPDGTLEVRVTSQESPLPGGERSTPIFIAVSDFNPVTGAEVRGWYGNQIQTFLSDDGSFPDARAGDGTYSATFSVPEGITTFDLQVRVRKSGFAEFNGTFPLPVVSRPPNDNFSGAASTTGSRSAGSNANAGAESGEPRNPSSAGGKSVWWRWVAPASEDVLVTTFGSNFDTTLAVYRGSSLAGLQLLGSNDDYDGLQSGVAFPASAGTTYYFQVDGWNGATGSILLNHPVSGSTSQAPRIIEVPRGGTVLEGQSFTFSVGATGQSLSYQWFKDGSPLSGWTSATETIAATTEADEGSYHVRVTNSHGSVNSQAVFLSVNQVVVLPNNDNFANAYRLEGVQGRATGQNRDATGESGEPIHHGNSSPLNSLWFRWRANRGGDLALSTDGSNFDTVLAVYTGSGVNSLSLVASDDDSGEGLRSGLGFRAEAGVTYWIAVDGFSSAVGDVVLNHLFAPDPDSSGSADFFRDRLPLAGSAVVGNNTAATGEAGEPNHAGRSQPLQSVWWYWVAPQSGFLTLDTIGSNFDTTLAVYRGTQVGALSLVASNDDASGLQSRVEFYATGGVNYAIAVDGYSGYSGDIQLNAAFLSDDGNEYEFDPNFGALLVVGTNRFFSPSYGTVSFADGGFDRGWAWSESLQGWLTHSGRTVWSAEYGFLTPGTSIQWVSSRYFGWVHFGFGRDQYGGWVWSERFGWMKFEHSGSGVYLYVPRLEGWLAVRSDGSFYSFDYRELIPTGLSTYRSPLLGNVTVGDFNGWVHSSRFGWVWAARNTGGVWFWSETRQDWLGVMPDGAIWSTKEGRFL